MTKLLFLLFALTSVSTFAQTQFYNCNENTPIKNLMVFDSNNYYIGLTNENGVLEKEFSDTKLVINHPSYGNQTITVSDKSKICIDFFNEELEELFIEKGLHLQKELLQALEISFKAFSDEKSGKSIYKISDHAYMNNMLNESLLGYIKVNSNGKSIRYLDPHYKFTEYIHKKEYNYYINPQYSAFALDKQIYYETEGKKVHYDFKAVEVNLPKIEISDMKSYPLVGIGLKSLISVYMNQRRAYNYEKLGIDKGTTPWYYK